MNESPPSAWARAMQHLADAGDRLADELRRRGEPEDEVDVALALLGATMYAYLTQVRAEPDHPRFMPGAGYYTHIGSPSPDTIYRTTVLDGGGLYRLTGDHGAAVAVSFMPFGRATPQGLQTFPAFELADLPRGADGSFDVILSQRRPDGHDGPWWPIDPDVRSLMARSVATDWSRAREPRLAIVRLDTPARRPRTPAETLERRVATLGTTVERMIRFGLQKTDRMIAEIGVNALALTDYSASGGLAGQWYHEGAFSLADSESLVLELQPPAGAQFSLSLTNRLFCTVDWTYAQSSLNAEQTTVDDDGRLRVVVSAADPGVANWLDTTGYRSGAVQCRWTRCEHAPELSARVMPTAEVGNHLPASTARITAEERNRTLQARSTAAQLRSLW